MEGYRNYLYPESSEDESINGIFLTIFEDWNTVYGYCIAKKRLSTHLFTYCFFYSESDSLDICEDEIDVEHMTVVISTTEERLKMLDALRTYGYKWNFQRKQIEE